MKPRFDWKLLLGGYFMGIAAIIPGVSSGTVAVIVKVYDRLVFSVDAVIRRKPEWLASLILLITLYGGNFLALFTLAGLMESLLENYPALMRIFFMGLIVGSLPIIIKKTTERDEKRFTLGTAIAFILSVGFLVGLNLIVNTDIDANPITTLTLGISFLIFITGFVASATAIVPGVSGSMIQLAIGMYPTFVNALSTFNIPILIVLFGGMVLGLIGATRLITYLLKRFYQITYFAIIGLLIGSIYQIWPESLEGSGGFISLAIGVFISGFTLAYLSHFLDKKKYKKTL
jgi:putative membrane protein